MFVKLKIDTMLSSYNNYCGVRYLVTTIKISIN